MFTRKRFVLYAIGIVGCLIIVGLVTSLLLCETKNNNTQSTDYSRIIDYQNQGKGYMAAQEAARLYFDPARFSGITSEQKVTLASILVDNDREYLAQQIIDSLSDIDFFTPSKRCEFIVEKTKIYMRRYHYEAANSLVNSMRDNHTCDSYTTELKNALTNTSTVAALSTSDLSDISAAFHGAHVASLLTQIDQATDEAKQNDLINTLLNIEPDNASLYIDLGLLFYSTKEYEKMLTYVQKATEIDPYYNRAWNSYCLALLGPSLDNIPILPQRIEEGILACKHAVSLDPEYPRPHNNLGLLYVAKKDYTAAEEEYKRAVELGIIPKGSTYAVKPMHNLAEMYRVDLGKYDDALVLYTKVLELEPDFTLARYGRGVILFKIKHNYTDALKDLLVVLNGTHLNSQIESNTLTLITNCYGLLNQPDYVILYAKRMIEKSLHVSHAYLLMGTAYVTKGMIPEANTAFQKCIDIDGCPDLPRKH